MKTFLFIFLLTISIYAQERYTNALISESSPYLQQHAHNPVDWYPWNQEVFEKAKREKKLIFVSIGYSTCHWCHVMEEESFTDTKIAKLLNKDYISIKVDREEYPQIDKRYQRLYSSVSGRSGGWPLSIFLTPDMKPIYISTYIPKYEGYGSMGMMDLLPHLSNIFHNSSETKKRLISTYESASKDIYRDTNESIRLNGAIIKKALDEIEKSYDRVYGGFSHRPKFPESSKISLLLDIYKITQDQRAFNMARDSLKKMAFSGLYDHIDGGFFRYTTDKRWQIPHFEKMLYTNAELISLYVDLYKIDPNPLYMKVVRESISEMQRHLSKDDLYLSASDADSNSEEGGYYIYNYTNIVDGLKQKGFSHSEIVDGLKYLGIEEDGNIDGELSHIHITSTKKSKRVDEIKSYLKELRKDRVFPFVDQKINTAWSGMMIKALFKASEIDDSYTDIAKRAMDRLLDMLSKGDQLYHQTMIGERAKQLGLLEDYAFVIEALIEAHQATLDEYYLHRADKFAKRAISLFYRHNRWYMSSDEIDTLADIHDSLYSSALSTILYDLSSLALLEDDISMNNLVDKTLQRYGKVLNNAPSYAPRLTSTLLLHKVGGLVIKSSYKNLKSHRDKISKIAYPFIYQKVQKEDDYLACQIGSCFAYSIDIDRLISKIASRSINISKE